MGDFLLQLASYVFGSDIGKVLQSELCSLFLQVRLRMSPSFLYLIFQPEINWKEQRFLMKLFLLKTWFKQLFLDIYRNNMDNLKCLKEQLSGHESHFHVLMGPSQVVFRNSGQSEKVESTYQLIIAKGVVRILNFNANTENEHILNCLELALLANNIAFAF